jgi:hypothetical protein
MRGLPLAYRQLALADETATRKQSSDSHADGAKISHRQRRSQVRAVGDVRQTGGSRLLPVSTRKNRTV